MPPPTEKTARSSTVGDRACRCISVGEQIHCHSGYESTDKDTSDIKLLATRFDFQSPPPDE